jgi:hypothetical protein
MALFLLLLFFSQFCDKKIGKKLKKLGKFSFKNLFYIFNNISHEENFPNFLAKKATHFVLEK